MVWLGCMIWMCICFPLIRRSRAACGALVSRCLRGARVSRAACGALGGLTQPAAVFAVTCQASLVMSTGFHTPSRYSSNLLLCLTGYTDVSREPRGTLSKGGTTHLCITVSRSDLPITSRLRDRVHDLCSLMLSIRSATLGAKHAMVCYEACCYM
jgi:hypothetical protein